MITELLSKVDTISQQFIINGYQELANTYAPAIYGLAALSVIVYGYAVLQGFASLSLTETSKRALLMGFILSFALNWGIFSQYIFAAFTKVPNEIAEHLIRALPNSPYHSGGSINTAIQDAWNEGMTFFSVVWERGGLRNVLPYFYASGILILLVLLVGTAIIELIVAKFGLAIFLVLAPLAISMCFFKATKEIIFDGWLKHLVTFACIPIFVTAVLALSLTLLSDSIIDMQQAIHADKLSITAIAPYIFFLFISIGLLLKATHIASSLAGGFASSMTPHAANAMKKGLNLLKRSSQQIKIQGNNNDTK